jgi:hypothetical protein
MERDGLGTNERSSAHVTENHSVWMGVKFESITEKMNLCLILNLSSPCIFVSAYTIYYTNKMYILK